MKKIIKEKGGKCGFEGIIKFKKKKKKKAKKKKKKKKHGGKSQSKVFHLSSFSNLI